MPLDHLIEMDHVALAGRCYSSELEISSLRQVIECCIPWLASHPRGAAQEALADACLAVGYDALEWSGHPDVLLRRRPELDRRDSERTVTKQSEQDGSQNAA